MYNQDEILAKIKSVVLEEIPDAKVYLFGSRVTGKIHEESDWDILVLTQKKYPKSTRRLIDEKLFPLSISVGSDFSFLITTKDDWEKHPGYYSLQLGIADQYIIL
ncbi:MAG TPA: nucleotidyltransferase domain-containing protein [Chitinophagaceae bacterium]|nr:nucleotidyltransferase domain-containing protein [Chitinophagaceae bacterium]